MVGLGEMGEVGEPSLHWPSPFPEVGILGRRRTDLSGFLSAMHNGSRLDVCSIPYHHRVTHDCSISQKTHLLIGRSKLVHEKVSYL